MLKTHPARGLKSTIFAIPLSRINMAQTVPPTLTQPTICVTKMLNTISVEQNAPTMDLQLDWTAHNVDVPQIQPIFTIFPGE